LGFGDREGYGKAQRDNIKKNKKKKKRFRFYYL